MSAATVVHASSSRGIRRQEGPHRLRCGPDPHSDFGRDAERAFAADEESDQIEAGRIGRRAAETRDFAVGQDDGEPQDVARRHAVLQAVRATGVFGDVAADRARHLTRGVGCIGEALGRDRAGQKDIHDTRLDDGVAIVEIGCEDALHPRPWR